MTGLDPLHTLGAAAGLVKKAVPANTTAAVILIAVALVGILATDVRNGLIKVNAAVADHAHETTEAIKLRDSQMETLIHATQKTCWNLAKTDAGKLECMERR